MYNRLFTLLVVFGFLTQNLFAPLSQANPVSAFTAAPVVAALKTTDRTDPPAASVVPTATHLPAPIPAAGASTSSASAPLGVLPRTQNLGDCNLSNSTINCQVADPVTMPTGNFWHSFSDLTVAGRGAGLQFTRTYNSLPANLANPPGRLGSPGWTDNYNMSIGFICDVYHCPDLTVTQENGSTAMFFNVGGPSYPVREGTHATLISNTLGSFVFTRNAGQTSYYFHHCDPQINARTPCGGNFSDPLAGKLEQIVDHDNYTTTLAYTTTGTLAGFLNTATDTAGRSLQFSYSQVGTLWLLTRVQDPSGRHVDYTYDAVHDLRTATDVAGQQSSYTYDSYHQMLTLTDPRAGVVTNSYRGSDGVISRQVDPVGNAANFEFAETSCGGFSGYITAAVTDTRGLATHYVTPCMSYAADHRIISTIINPNLPDQAVWSFTYSDGDHFWDPTTVQDPNGHIYTTTYDLNGNVSSTTDPLGRTVSTQYNATSNPTMITDTRGVTTTLGYDSYGNLTSISQPLTQTQQVLNTTLAYDPLHPGDLLTVTNPLTQSWTMQHDPLTGFVLSTTNPLAETSSVQRNTLGWVTSARTPLGHSTGFTYNTYGDPLVITNSLNYTTTYSYDSNRNLSSVSDANGHPTSYTYDLANRLTRVTQPDGTHSDSYYDGDGNVITTTNGLTQTTSYRYDRFNRVSGVTDALTRSAAYAYDPVGNLTVLTDAVGLTTTFGYDSADQLRAIIYHDGGVTSNVGYSYSAPGMRTAMTDGTGTTTYTYDSLGRPTSRQNGAGQTVGYGYDRASNRTSLTYPGSGTVTYGYDTANQMIAVQDWLSNTTGFSYDLDGQLTTRSYPNSLSMRVGYDAAGQVQSIAHGGVKAFLELVYTRDPTGQVRSVSDSVNGFHSYTYDPLDRLTGDGLSATPAVSTTWGYDAATQITTTRYQSGTGLPTTGTHSFDAAGQLISRIEQQNGSTTGNWSYSFDGKGNRTNSHNSVGSTIDTTYSYNQANRLTHLVNDRADFTYRYDGDGLRQAKSGIICAVICPNNSTTTNFVWDSAGGLPLLLQEQITPSGSTTSTTSYIYGPGGAVVEQVAGSTPYYYHPDQLGSIRALTDGSGTVVASRDYDGYGNPTVTSGSVRTPFGYAGEYTDAESGLVYLRARYYDPPTQQFLAHDTLLTQLPYSYVNGNPLNLRDPSGHGPEILILVGALACPECVVGGLLFTAGVVLTLESAAIIHDYLVRQQAANQVCEAQLGQQTDNARLASSSAQKAAQEIMVQINGKTTVRDILKNKRGNIKNAKLDPGTPGWDEIQDLTWDDIVNGARQNKPGFKTIKKVLGNIRFDK